MSRSRLTELACIAALALGGCMKIYPDPELPDIDVEWYDGDCPEDGGGNVVLTLTGVDDTTVHHELSAPCADATATFKDVARQRYKLAASLLDMAGTEYNRTQAEEIDLRNGIDNTAYLYFGGFSNFRVEWTFEAGATCQSLDIDWVQVEFMVDDQTMFADTSPCYSTPRFGNAPDGIYTVRARGADSQGTTRVVSASKPDVVIDFETITDIGTLVLAPCGDACP